MTQLSHLDKEKIDRFFTKSEGTAVPSFVSYFLDRGIEGNLSQEDSLKYSAATMFAGGADTVSNVLLKTIISTQLFIGRQSPSALKTFIRAMVLYPDVQRRAQDEISLIVGNDRLPAFADRELLPYTNAIIKEAIRWESVLPTGAQDYK